MVQPTGLEPVTSSFAGRRSNPTELRLHIFLDDAIVCIFGKMQGQISIFYLAPWHSVEVKSLKIRHRFSEEVLFLSFFEESSLIDDAEFNQGISIFCWEFFLRKCFFILHIPSSFLV